MANYRGVLINRIVFVAKVTKHILKSNRSPFQKKGYLTERSSIRCNVHKIIQEEENYLYAEFTSALMGYVDDVEFYLHQRSDSCEVCLTTRRFGLRTESKTYREPFEKHYPNHDSNQFLLNGR